jgi:O-methyltransferase
MSAKMSIMAEAVGKELIVFDSFQGLPHDEEFTKFKGEWMQNQSHDELVISNWKKGMFECSQETVRQNIEKFGVLEVTTLIPGLFEDTLHKHPCNPSFIFVDVDLIKSAWVCVEYFWHRLRGPRFYSHEFNFPSYAGAILNRLIWAERMGCSAPQYVQFRDAPHLAYLKK